MKKIFMIFSAGILFCSCNNARNISNAPMSSNSTNAVGQKAMNYPYTIDHPDNWYRGDNKNTMLVLNSLKAVEMGNVTECMKYFGDSIRIQYDALDAKLSNDRIKAFFTISRNALKTFKVKMSDWESVISKDKKEEWVTLWYREVWEDLKGVKDSVDVVDDFEMKDGKIIRLDEYTRKLH